MELTQEILDRYVGGQLEVQSRNEGYLYRGEIISLQLTGEGDESHLEVSFKWLAKMDEDSRWEVSDPEPYRISLLIYSVSDVGVGRLAFHSVITGETTVLFPPGGDQLDPAKVRGLVLNT